MRAQAAELAGCPESFVASLEKDPAGSGKLVLTMDYPHVMGVNKSCSVPATRKVHFSSHFSY